MNSVPPAPPYCSGTSMPMSPSSKYLGRSAGSILPAFSISATRGRTSSWANEATASRNMSSSSERSVSAELEEVVSVCMGANASPFEDDLGQLLVQSESGRHAECHVRKLLRGPGDETWNVGSRMPTRREHVGKNRDVSRAGFDATGESGGDVRFCQLHVRVANDDI